MQASKRRVLKYVILGSILSAQFLTFNSVKANELKKINNSDSINNIVLKSDNLNEKKHIAWIEQDGKWYYINSDGSKHTGWLNLNNTYYYLDPVNGEMQTGMKEINGYKYYLDNSGAMQTGWVKYNGEYYFFGSDGAMRTGWINDGWTDYYLKKDGTIYKGWLDDGLNKYFMDENGQMRKGWVKYNGEYYFFGPDGAMRTGWINDGWTDYYLKKDGTIYKGWLDDGLNKYFMDENGQMRKGWVKYNGEYYFFGPDGAMRTGWINDGYAYYFMNNNGQITKGWFTEGNNKYYLGNDGAMRTGWQEIDNNWYYFEQSGFMARNKIIEDWYVNSNGVGGRYIEKSTYGKSGRGRDLEYYRVGSGKKVLFAVFGVHGYEDAWDGDAQELYLIAQKAYNNLVKQYEVGINADDLSEWSVYLIPSANPDGRIDGWTNYGPGRTTITTKNDINRSFPIGFRPYYSARNYTGDSYLGSPEAKALYNFINKTMDGATEKILLDVHGWEDKTIGDSNIASYFDKEFGFRNIPKYPGGFVITYGNAIGAKSVLVELPFPKSHEDILRRDFSGKFSRALLNILLNN
ncbi:M14 family zinc carboxypeptidase [Clostridium perfringens]|uniref:M14 family zinc carboxypeptidase n=2 Tax=Clostridium perfringens TaxID=1502 RepID=UPI0030D0C2A5